MTEEILKEILDSLEWLLDEKGIQNNAKLPCWAKFEIECIINKIKERQ